MRNVGTVLRKNIASNGAVAKSLSVFYIAWLIGVIDAIVNTRRHPMTWELLVLSIIGTMIPAFIGTLFGGVYTVFMYGNTKRSKQYLGKMDERQLQARRQIFEKSYALLASLALFFAFVGSSWFGNSLSQFGLSLIGYNVFFFIIALPSLVAVWDTNPVTHTAV